MLLDTNHTYHLFYTNLATANRFIDASLRIKYTLYCLHASFVSFLSCSCCCCFFFSRHLSDLWSRCLSFLRQIFNWNVDCENSSYSASSHCILQLAWHHSLTIDINTATGDDTLLNVTNASPERMRVQLFSPLVVPVTSVEKSTALSKLIAGDILYSLDYLYRFSSSSRFWKRARFISSCTECDHFATRGSSIVTPFPMDWYLGENFCFFLFHAYEFTWPRDAGDR